MTMMIEYRQTRDFAEEDLRRLFLSVGWESGRYPQKARDCDVQLNARHFGLRLGPADRTVACP